MAEVSYFDAAGISVTDKRLMVPGGDTYVMNQVSSVKARITEPKRKGPAILTGIGLLAFFGGKETIVVALLATIAGIAWFMMQKKTYHVILTFAGTETEALHSNDSELVGKVVDAVNRVIIDK